jgi:hypothetical protein
MYTGLLCEETWERSVVEGAPIDRPIDRSGALGVLKTVEGSPAARDQQRRSILGLKMHTTRGSGISSLDPRLGWHAGRSCGWRGHGEEQPDRSHHRDCGGEKQLQ